MHPIEWALQGQNAPPNTPEKQAISHAGKAGAAKSAAFPASSFADAAAAIMRLPLSDAEKAEAVRRLLADQKETRP